MAPVTIVTRNGKKFLWPVKLMAREGLPELQIAIMDRNGKAVVWFLAPRTPPDLGGSEPA